MSDDKSKDGKRINVNEAYELGAQATKFGVSPEQSKRLSHPLVPMLTMLTVG